jgi:predicted MPP superfamily phosphohydrolase
VLISDLHSTIFGKDQSKLIDKIKKQNPDLIVLTGDIFDDIVPHDGTKLLLTGINGISPIYYVTGNHEFWSRRVGELREELKSYGVIILSDEYKKIEIKDNEIIIAGIDDPDKKLYETPDYDQNKVMETQFRELDDLPAYKILLAHRPERIKYYQKFSFNLILSGHAHGGQVRLPPILNGLYAPHQGFFPKYVGGLYQYDNSTHIISRGLSINPLVPRIFNPPELVLIIIKSSNPAASGEVVGWKAGVSLFIAQDMAE